MDTDSDSGMTVLAADACWALLRSTDVGRLAVCVAGEPDVFPVNYVVDQGTIVFRTAAGTKLASAVISDVVAFEADGRDASGGEAWSVVVKGRAEQITRMQEMIDTTGLPLFPLHAGAKPRFVRVVPDDVSGRRFSIAEHTRWDTPLTGAPHTSPD